MKKSHFRILFSLDDGESSGWAFDDEPFESSAEAFEYAMEKYPHTAFRVIKLIYPQED